MSEDITLEDNHQVPHPVPSCVNGTKFGSRLQGSQQTGADRHRGQASWIGHFGKQFWDPTKWQDFPGEILRFFVVEKTQEPKSWQIGRSKVFLHLVCIG